VPRDRNGTFDLQIVRQPQRPLTGVVITWPVILARPTSRREMKPGNPDVRFTGLLRRCHGRQKPTSPTCPTL
jgi:hypothetical protein